MRDHLHKELCRLSEYEVRNLHRGTRSNSIYSTVRLSYPWAQLIKHHAMQRDGKMKAQRSRWRRVVSFMPLPFNAGTHCREGWVGPRVGLDIMKKRKYLAPAENRTLPRLFWRPACNLDSIPIDIFRLPILPTVLICTAKDNNVTKAVYLAGWRNIHIYKYITYIYCQIF
jgi:hypothetical protein